MDLNALKLELLERIANLDDEARLLALKRLLDGPPTYAIPGDHLSVVREGQAPYLMLEDRMYTAEEVRAMVRTILEEFEAVDEDMDPEVLTELEKRHGQMGRGEVKGKTWEEVQGLLDADRNKQRDEA